MTLTGHVTAYVGSKEILIPWTAHTKSADGEVSLDLELHADYAEAFTPDFLEPLLEEAYEDAVSLYHEQREANADVEDELWRAP
jgi:hypothetical protein